MKAVVTSRSCPGLFYFPTSPAAPGAWNTTTDIAQAVMDSPRSVLGVIRVFLQMLAITFRRMPDAPVLTDGVLRFVTTSKKASFLNDPDGTDGVVLRKGNCYVQYDAANRGVHAVTGDFTKATVFGDTPAALHALCEIAAKRGYENGLGNLSGFALAGWEPMDLIPVRRVVTETYEVLPEGIYPEGAELEALGDTPVADVIVEF